jgi:hypothetical protein
MHLLLEDNKMLTKLLPEQISKFWDIISYAVENSLPPTVGEHPDKINRILSSCLCGGLDVWASYDKHEDVIKFEGIVLTKILYDDASYTRSLLIYCLYGYEEVNKESWSRGLKALLKYAKKKECSKISAYTNSKYLIKLAENLGAASSYTYISFDVNELIKKINLLEESDV